MASEGKKQDSYGSGKLAHAVALNGWYLMSQPFFFKAKSIFSRPAQY